jgi:hypothetical protein
MHEVLAVAAGERVQTVASQLQCDPSTIWRVCRGYEQAGMAAVVERAQRAGRLFYSFVGAGYAIVSTNANDLFRRFSGKGI